ncbi:MAG TPA: glycoside hydrolase family 130 protein [Chryseolinea sp.]
MMAKSGYLKLTVPIILLTLYIIGCKTEKNRISADGVDPDSSWALLSFVKADTVNPVLEAGENSFQCPILRREVKWDEKDVFNPAAVVRDDKVYLIFRAEDKVGKFAGTSRLGLAVSNNGLHFNKSKEPVFFPDEDSLKVYEWEGGVEDPRIVESEDSTYIMTYTAYDGHVARLMLATSRDLLKWAKYGPVLKGKNKNTWSKSGAIVTRQEGSRFVATKINGKYWMYFGDTDLFILTSDDLIKWEPIEENGKFKSVLKPREGYFDSRLVESGPFALLTTDGILLLYNGMNHDTKGDTTIAQGAYCAGQVLFDKNDPTSVKSRLEKNFLQPSKLYETTGQINQVCFVEGLVNFRDKWFLYYGTADSKIAVAVK